MRQNPKENYITFSGEESSQVAHSPTIIPTLSTTAAGVVLLCFLLSVLFIRLVATALTREVEIRDPRPVTVSSQPKACCSSPRLVKRPAARHKEDGANMTTARSCFRGMKMVGDTDGSPIRQGGARQLENRQGRGRPSHALLRAKV